MGAAVDDGEVQINPCVAARKSLPRLPEPRPTVLTEGQVAVVRAHLAEQPYGLMLDVMAYTGARIGEVLALRRRPVDLLGKRLIVRQNVVEVGGHQKVSDTKTHVQRT
jgi:integrase